VPAVKVEAHEAVESSPRQHSGQRLYVRTFHLPGSFSNFPFSDDSPRVRTEGDATATSGLEINNGHAQIVRVQQNLDF
jgi:hypothetical protein